MNIKRRIARFLTSTLLTKIKYGIADAKRVIGRAPHEVHYFHQVDDPYSHLMAQVLHAFENAYNVKLIVHLVNPPTDDIAPDRQDLIDYSRRDAEKISPYHNLSFTDPGAQPSDEALHMARRALAGSSKRSKAAAKIGEAYWKNNIQALRNMSLVSPKETEAIFANGTKKRDSLGHYLGAMVYYGGEWYWGVDRLFYLEQRLRDLSAGGHGDYLAPRPEIDPGNIDASAFTLAFYPSLNSPYSSIIFDKTMAVKNACRINFLHKPVLPMIMRGVAATSAKGDYIFFDTKREAETLGVGFGPVITPIGDPTRDAYALLPLAFEQGKDEALMKSLLDAAWRDNIALHTSKGMRAAVERAGIDWREAEKWLGRDDWKQIVAQHQHEMVTEMGLWGVPSYRLSGPDGEDDLQVWGQDRLWLIAAEIKRRAAAFST